MSRLCLIALALCALAAFGCSKAPQEKPAAQEKPETETAKTDTSEPKKETPKETEKEEPQEIEVGVIETEFGKIVIEFYPDSAPKTVARIKELIKRRFYNGLTFHRVVPGFCIQGGDPEGTGRGGTGQNIPGEFSNRQFDDGAVGMARSKDPDSNDCQFFITLSRAENVAGLDGLYTLFGHVIEGLDVAHKIEKSPVIGQKPKDTILILSFTLEKRKKEK